MKEEKVSKISKIHPVKIIISILIGFLPSFIFILLFIQYGNPIENYFNFLFDFSSSAGAWISAILISLFAYFVIGVIGSRNLFKKMLENKILFVFIIVCFIIAFVLLAIQLYLYTNFILRNDILVEVSADKENIFFTDNPKEEISFSVNLIMNPFCVAECEYKFLDLTTGKVLDENSFNTTILSKKRIYDVENANLVEGSQELKQFEISCKSRKTFFCYTSGRESKRKILVTVNYELSEEEEKFKNKSREKIENSSKLLYSSKENLVELSEKIKFTKEYFLINKILEENESLNERYKELNDSLEVVEFFWKKQNFDEIEGKIEDLKTNVDKLNNNSKEINDKFNLQIDFYNSLVENLADSKKMLYSCLNNSECGVFNEIVRDYNKALNNFANNFSLSIKEKISEEIYEKVKTFYDVHENNPTDAECILEQEIEKEPDKLFFDFEGFPEKDFSLKNPEPVCCFKGECKKCCENECSDENYPILFLHGHSINKESPIGYSFGAFAEIKEKLISEGDYVDAGSIIISPEINEGLWGKMHTTFIMTGSYFFDTYHTEAGVVTIASNDKGIDTYAKRLNELVKLIKNRTKKDKIIIAAHSMGGVITRRYIQIFGNSDIDKIILVTSPNHGVDDKVRDYCAVIGPEASCKDLDRDGDLMQKLNSEPTEYVSTYNIIGVGCNMGEESGDGVIKESSQYLVGAKNFYFEGKCDEINFEFFHEYILFPRRYPEVYRKILEILER